MNYLLDSAVYEETKRIALGKSKKSPMLIEFSDWFTETYSGKMLNFEFGIIKHPRIDRYRLNVIIEHTEDYQRMYIQAFQPNVDYQGHVASEFRRIALKYHFATESQLENLFVIYSDFSHEAKVEANGKATRKFSWLVKFKYPVVWKVITMFSGSAVFYYSDLDISTNETKGITKSITNDYFTILKKHDEFDYYTRENILLKFDSKENLDKNFEGSLFYYTR